MDFELGLVALFLRVAEDSGIERRLVVACFDGGCRFGMEKVGELLRAILAFVLLLGLLMVWNYMSRMC